MKIQKISQYASVNPSISVGEYEQSLNKDGFTSGLWPLSGFSVTLADCINERIPNLYFIRYGGIEDVCLGGRALTPEELVLEIKRVPRSAVGPDLKKVLIGSHGKIGNFEEVSLKIFPQPQTVQWGLLVFKDVKAQEEAFKRLYGVFIRPLYVRFLNTRDGNGILRSLNLKEEGTPVLAIKLAGLKCMVQAEVETIEQTFDGHVIHWPQRPAQSDIMDQTLITVESYEETLKHLEPMFGLNLLAARKFENKLENFFGDNPC